MNSKEEKDPTKGFTLRQLARKLNHRIEFGFETHCYIDGAPMKGHEARQLFRKELESK